MTSHSATVEGQPREQILVYQDQGHITRILTGSGASLATAWRYYYDADGKRRIKAEGPAPGTGTPPLTLAEAFANSSFSFYAGEDLICQLDTGTQVAHSAPGVPGPDTYAPKFLLTDHLGTTRAELTFDEDHDPVISKTYDYLPYGEEISPAASTTEQLKFTGKQRDTESGLDFFGARYYGNTLFRWTSPDGIFVDNLLEAPQSWNLYMYVRNDPINKMDLDGCELTTSELQRMKEIAGKDANLVKDENNDGKIDAVIATQEQLDNNEGLKLIKEVVESKKNIVYKEGSTTETQGGVVPNDGVDNLDKNKDPRFAYRKNGGDKYPTELPPTGVDDMIVIDPKVKYVDAKTRSKDVAPAALAFHEIGEALEKVENGLTYLPSNGKPGAHAKAGEREQKLLQQNPSFTQFPAGGKVTKKEIK